MFQNWWKILEEMFLDIGGGRQVVNKLNHRYIQDQEVSN